MIESASGVDYGPATRRGRTLPFEQLNGCLHPGQRIQDFVRELCCQLADCRQLLALDQTPPMLEQRRVGLLQLFDDRAHLIAQRLQAGASRREVNARSLGSRFDLDLELIHRLRDPPSPQKPHQQAGDGAGNAGPHKDPRQSPHRPLGCGQRLLRVGARHPPKLGEQIPQLLGLRVSLQESVLCFSGMAVVEERHRFSACTVIGRVVSLNLSEQLLGARAADRAVHARQPRLEGRPAVVELLEPGPVPRQKVFGHKSLLIKECAHRGGVVDEGELAADGHAGHRRGVPERE